jgi:hypothetical protein
VCPGATAHAADAGDDLLEGALVVGELAAQLLYHAVDVVELGLVTGRGGEGHHAAGHVGAVDAVHGSELWLGDLLLGLLLLILRCWS